MEVNGAYAARRSLLESVEGGSDYYLTEGNVKKICGTNGEEFLQNSIVFQGWRHDSANPENQTLVVENQGGNIEYETSGDFKL